MFELNTRLRGEALGGFPLMECYLFSVRMRSPPPSFRGVFFLPACPIQYHSLKYSHKHQSICRKFQFSSRLKRSLYALDAIESKHTELWSFGDALNSPLWLQDGFQRETCQLSDSNRPKGYRVPETVEKKKSWKALDLASKERLRRYSGMLRTCASKGALSEGKAIHGQLIRCGINPDSHLWNSLINVYAKCGSSKYASKVFAEIPERDVVSWTSLIAGFVAEGHGSGALNLFWEMRKEGVGANEFTYATALKACSMCLDVELGKQVHAEAIKVGGFSDLFVGSALVDLYAKGAEMVLAERVFLCMPEKNSVSWNALLNGFAQMGDAEKVLNLFCRMTGSEIDFSKFTLSTVLKSCANSGTLKVGQTIHSLAVRIGSELDEFISCCLVDMYSKCGLAGDALKVFATIKDPDVVSWSAIITCLNQKGQSREAAEVFKRMTHSGIVPNQFTLASLVSAATDLGDLYYGQSIHACVCKYGFEYDNTVCNALITMYMKIGSVQDGCQVFDLTTNRDLISWNALLSGFHDNETCDIGLRIFIQMLVEGFNPNMYTFISVLRFCSSLADVGFGKQVHAQILKNSLDGNEFVGTALIDMYAKSRLLEDAETIFDTLIKRDIFAWTVIIAGFAQEGQGEKAMKYFIQMQRECVKPNEFTLASSLSGCSRIATLDSGQQLHSMAIKSGQSGDMFVASALVDMYAKCGCIEDAEVVFDGLVSRDTISWNTMICGYSQHGQGQKALQAFEVMLDEGILPDEVTFIGVLSACSHMGLTKEGKMHFNSLRKIYGITPTTELYACIVDILGRAGKFDEIESFIEEMQLTSNLLIWENVLGACKMHGNVEFGERAAMKLFELEPEIDSNYILLSNIYAAKGMWDDVMKVRALMSTRGVKKEPGCSWVEVNGQIHVFLSHDGSHPKTGEIHLKLQDLHQKLMLTGYTPNTDHVLHNVPDREKQEHLFYHSERLALAFALLSISTRKTIRIFKNLRICGDCHDFMKSISEITNHELVVRDINCFHHFKNGSCSCQNFW